MEVEISVTGLRVAKRTGGSEPKLVALVIDERAPNTENPWTEEIKELFGVEQPVGVGNNVTLARSPVWKGITGSEREMPGDGSRVQLFGNGWNFYRHDPGGSLSMILVGLEDDKDLTSLTSLLNGVLAVPVISNLIDAGAALTGQQIGPVIGVAREKLMELIGAIGKDDRWLEINFSGSKTGRYCTLPYPGSRGQHMTLGDGATAVSFRSANKNLEVDFMVVCRDVSESSDDGGAEG